MHLMLAALTETTIWALVGLAALPLLGALTYATAVGGKALRDWLTTKTGNSLIAREALVLSDLATSIVADIEANEKAALEAKNGTLTASDLAGLKALAMERLKAVLQAKGMATLQAMLGALATPAQVDQVLSGKVEQAVTAISSGAALKSIASPH